MPDRALSNHPARRCPLLVPDRAREPDQSERAHDSPDGRYRLAASRTPAPDPVVYLAGGPGGYALGEAQLLIDAGFNRDRDLILMGSARDALLAPNPAPTCPEADLAATRGLGLPLDGSAYRRLTVAAVQCL